MNQKGFANIILIIVIVVLVGAVGYFAFVKKSEPTAEEPPPTLSADRKRIIANGKVLLTINDDAIFNFFKSESQLCDGDNLTSTPDRKIFCEDKTTFGSKTRFTSIVSSPDKTKIGFTIESDTLSPDKVAGIFYPSRLANNIYFLTNYYLGNEFISFSPNGTNLVYQGGCFEGMCELSIKNSETLTGKTNLSDSEFADARTKTVTFVRWISDNQVEYKLGSELKSEKVVNGVD